MTQKKKLILLALNEVNLDVVKLYTQRLRLINFKLIIDKGILETSSESEYEKLEPWIQWASAHTGKTADEHGVFRLGDMVNADNIPQIFEKVEGMGFDVGCISPMNAVNRLVAPSYFVPDPWTDTLPDGSFWSRILSYAISQAVNDNAKQKLTAKSIVYLFAGLSRFARPINAFRYVKLAIGSRGAPWRKALFLDLFLHDLHMSLFKNKKPNFSTIFLNAGAHIQHHYFFNSVQKLGENQKNPSWYLEASEDPMADMFKVYDKILGDFLNLKNVDLILATGLTQKPYDRLKFYYRLKDHENFLAQAKIKFISVFPRMTRDFLVTFANSEDAKKAQEKLESIRHFQNRKTIFGDIENRGDSLFVTLSYPHEITETDEITLEDGHVKMLPLVVFVAIKNGMHDGKGFAYFSEGAKKVEFENGAHIKELHNSISRYFEQVV